MMIEKKKHMVRLSGCRISYIYPQLAAYHLEWVHASRSNVL